MNWIRRGIPEVEALEDSSVAEAQLRCRIARLERRVSMLYCCSGVGTASTARLRIQARPQVRSRFAGKQRLLGAVERASKSMPLSAALRVLGLFAAPETKVVMGSGVKNLNGDVDRFLDPLLRRSTLDDSRIQMQAVAGRGKV